jgi:hypothetical protein
MAAISAAQSAIDDATERMFLFMFVLPVLSFSGNPLRLHDITGGGVLTKKPSWH